MTSIYKQALNDHGSFTKAAASLNISRKTFCRHLDLEDKGQVANVKANSSKEVKESPKETPKTSFAEPASSGLSFKQQIIVAMLSNPSLLHILNAESFTSNEFASVRIEKFAEKLSTIA